MGSQYILITPFGRSLVDDADAAAARGTLGLDAIYAPLASPTFTGVPAVPTAAPGTDTTQAASTAFVRAEVAALVASSPAALDTLDELAAALGDDANFATTVTNALAGKQPLDADLTALAALSGTDTIYYRSAASTWTAVTIGSGLGFSGGTLSNTASGPSAANPTASVGLSAVNGSASTFLRSDGAPALDVTAAFAFTGLGVTTIAPAARSSGVAPYLTVTAPADTTLTASTEAIGVSFVGATRQHATGALTLQREYVFAAPTYSFAGASTITTAVTADFASPAAGTNATLTNSYAGRFVASATGHTALVVQLAGATATAPPFKVVDSSGNTLVLVTTSSTGDSHIGFGCAGFAFGDTGRFGVNSTSGAYFGCSGGGLVVTGTTVRPTGNSNDYATATDGLLNLGAATQRFLSIYSVQGNFFSNAAGTTPGIFRGTTSQSAVLVQLQGQSSTTAGVAQAEVDTAWIDSTHATRKARAVRRAWDTAARETDRGWADGTVGRFACAAPASAPTDAHLAASQISFYLDESGHNLIVRVKYADGTTMKTATIALT